MEEIRQRQQINAKVELITPEMAKAMLEQNHEHQRPVKRKRVENYIADMKNNTWVLNGETIVVADDGSILDGQHRLMAVAEAGIPISMLVVRGVEKEVDGIDTFSTINSENRSHKDVLYIAGFKDKTADFVKYIRLLEAFKTKRLKKKPSGIDLMNHEIVELAKTYNYDEALVHIERANNLYQRCDLIPKNIWILLATIEYEFDELHEFLEKLAECSITSDDTAIAALTRYLSNQDGMNNVKSYWILIFKAFNDYKLGKKVSKYRVSKGDDIRYPKSDTFYEEE